MPETATESFCERCGTRYDVRTDNGLGGLRRARATLSGLTHYVMSQDTLSDAIGDAMRMEEDRSAAEELSTFHSTFHFCMTCRQYACGNCWNDAAAQCRTCEPMVGPDAPPDPVVVAEARAAPLSAPPEPAPAFDAWPTEDLGPAGQHDVPETMFSGWPEADRASAEPVEAQDAPPIPVPDPAVEVEPEPVVAETPVEIEPEPVVEPELVVAEAVNEPEPRVEPEPVAPAAAAAPIQVDLPPEPMAGADSEAEFEPMAAFLATPEPSPATVEAPVRADVEVEPEPETADQAARRAQLDLLGLADPGQGTVADGTQEALPYRSSGAAAAPRQPRALAARMAANGMWDASVREVAGAGGTISDCASCGLQLSASARFCRRCGTPQTKSA